jgi:hypothetical protein
MRLRSEAVLRYRQKQALKCLLSYSILKNSISLHISCLRKPPYQVRYVEILVTRDSRKELLAILLKSSFVNSETSVVRCSVHGACVRSPSLCDRVPSRREQIFRPPYIRSLNVHWHVSYTTLIPMYPMHPALNVREFRQGACSS